MEKIKFAGQVLLYVTLIPVLFVATMVGQETRLQERKNNQALYSSYNNTHRTYAKGDPRVARIIFSCRPPMVVKK